MGKIKSLQAHGCYPKTVYRVFDKLEYATDFLNGRFRFSRIQNYKNIEDALRRDDSEGESHVVYNGLSHHSSFASNLVYILCFHKTLKAARQSKFGKIIVKIKNPKKLAAKITAWLEEQPYQYIGGIEGINIEYTYGQEVDTKPESTERARLIYAQKPSYFSDENEFRFVFIRESCEDDHIFIDINGANELCSILTHEKK